MAFAQGEYQYTSIANRRRVGKEADGHPVIVMIAFDYA